MPAPDGLRSLPAETARGADQLLIQLKASAALSSPYDFLWENMENIMKALVYRGPVCFGEGSNHNRQGVPSL